MIVNQAFRYELDPNTTSRGALARNAGTARVAYDWGLDLCRACLEAEERLPGGMTPRRLWNRWKGDNAPGPWPGYTGASGRPSWSRTCRALNLERLVAGSSPETQDARGADVRPA